MKITIIVFVVILIILILLALMSRPNGRVQKILLEIIKGLIGCAIAIILAYWVACIIIYGLKYGY